MTKDIQVGDWILVRFPQDESGKKRKLSKPWHGPYRVVERRDPDVTVVPVHFPDSVRIQVHQSQVCLCPPKFPAGFYWYGGNRLSHGKIPKWLDELLSDESLCETIPSEAETMPSEHEQSDEPPPIQAGSTPPEIDTAHDQLESDRVKLQSPSPVQASGRYNLRQSIKPPDRLG